MLTAEGVHHAVVDVMIWNFVLRCSRVRYVCCLSSSIRKFMSFHGSCVIVNITKRDKVLALASVLFSHVYVCYVLD
jgi:hypothetical protein